MYTDGVWNAMKIKKRTQPVSIPTCFLTIWESEKAIGRNIQVRGCTEETCLCRFLMRHSFLILIPQLKKPLNISLFSVSPHWAVDSCFPYFCCQYTYRTHSCRASHSTLLENPSVLFLLTSSVCIQCLYSSQVVCSCFNLQWTSCLYLGSGTHCLSTPPSPLC